MEEILAMEHITKTYPGVKALDDVSISFIQGEVHAVMGENRRRKVNTDEDSERNDPGGRW